MGSYTSNSSTFIKEFQFITQSYSLTFYDICEMSDNSSSYGSPFPTYQARGFFPRPDWQLAFTHMPIVKCLKYLLVLVGTLSGWVETSPTTNRHSLTSSSEKSFPALQSLPLSSQTMAVDSPPRFPKPYPKPPISFGNFISHTIPRTQER